MKARIKFVSLLIIATIPARATPPTDLFLRGYSVIPAPQRVNLQSGDVEFDGTWTYDSGTVGPSHIAVRTFVKDLKDFHSFDLSPAGKHTKKVAVRSLEEPRLEV